MLLRVVLRRVGGGWERRGGKKRAMLAAEYSLESSLSRWWYKHYAKVVRLNLTNCGT